MNGYCNSSTESLEASLEALLNYKIYMYTGNYRRQLAPLSLTPAHPVSWPSALALAERRASSTHGEAGQVGVPLHSPRTSEAQHSRSPSA